MIKNKKIAVVILSYNGRNLLDESIGSMLQQKLKNIQIYVANDGSTDDTVEYIGKKYSSVKTITSPKNLGPAGISNYAAKQLTEEYIVFVSNDMKFDKNCIQELFNTVEHNPKIGICTAVLLKHDKDPVAKDYLIDNAGFDLDVFGFIEPKYTNQTLSQIPNKAFEVFASCGGCFIIKRSLFNQLGGFDVSFWGLSEDMDLSWRARLLGFDVYTQPKAFLYHHIHPTLSKLKRFRTRYLSERNNLTMLIKNYSLFNLLIILPFYFVNELFEILYHSIISLDPKLGFSIISAIYYNIVNLPMTLNKRHKIQSTRKLNDDVIFPKLRFTSFKLKIAFQSILK